MKGVFAILASVSLAEGIQLKWNQRGDPFVLSADESDNLWFNQTPEPPRVHVVENNEPAVLTQYTKSAADASIDLDATVNATPLYNMMTLTETFVP